MPHAEFQQHGQKPLPPQDFYCCWTVGLKKMFKILGKSEEPDPKSGQQAAAQQKYHARPLGLLTGKTLDQPWSQ